MLRMKDDGLIERSEIKCDGHGPNSAVSVRVRVRVRTDEMRWAQANLSGFMKRRTQSYVASSMMADSSPGGEAPGGEAHRPRKT